MGRLWRTATTTAVSLVSRDWSYAELDLEQLATVPSALPLLAYGTAYQPTLSLHVAGNFQGTANIFVQTVTPLITIDFVTWLCSHLRLRQAKYCRTCLLTYLWLALGLDLVSGLCLVGQWLCTLCYTLDCRCHTAVNVLVLVKGRLPGPLYGELPVQRWPGVGGSKLYTTN